MPDADHLPTITGYTIDGAAGRLSKRGLTNHDVQATAWAALGAVTASRWDRLELKQRQAGVFEVEGRNGSEERSGIYILTLGGDRLLPDAGSPATLHPPVEERSLADGDRHGPVHRPLGQRATWADWTPAAVPALTRSEAVTHVNAMLTRPISASAIAEWEREGVLPIPNGEPTTPSYPRAAVQVILKLISLQQAGRNHLDILETLRSTVEDLNAHADTALERMP